MEKTIVESYVSEFTLEGKIQDILTKKDSSIKYFQLVIAEDEYLIKVAKPIRKTASKILKIGDRVKVKGKRKQDPHKDKIEFKAYSIELLSQEKSLSPTNTKKRKPVAKILLCKKSSCWKRGGKAVLKSLEENLSDLNLKDSVEIKMTGCLKKCKQGPNAIVMPDKVQYTHLKPKQIPQLIAKHFTNG